MPYFQTITKKLYQHLSAKDQTHLFHFLSCLRIYFEAVCFSLIFLIRCLPPKPLQNSTKIPAKHLRNTPKKHPQTLKKRLLRLKCNLIDWSLGLSALIKIRKNHVAQHKINRVNISTTCCFDF